MEICERCNRLKADVTNFEISLDWIARFCQQCQRDYRSGVTNVQLIEQKIRQDRKEEQ
jgi:hypothetical protein